MMACRYLTLEITFGNTLYERAKKRTEFREHCATISGSGHSPTPSARLIAKFRILGQSALA
jgi:hypothetical protein